MSQPATRPTSAKPTGAHVPLRLIKPPHAPSTKPAEGATEHDANEQRLQQRFERRLAITLAVIYLAFAAGVGWLVYELRQVEPSPRAQTSTPTL